MLLSPFPTGEMTDGAAPLSPPLPSDSESGTLGGVVKRRHSRGRSVTSKAEMMSRPNSAKARVDYNSQPTGPREHALAGGVANRATSPPTVSGGVVMYMHMWVWYGC